MNCQFGFLRKAFDLITDKFTSETADSGFMTRKTESTELLLMANEFTQNYANFINFKVKVQLFQYFLTKFYMARDAQNTQKMFAILTLLRCFSVKVELKVIKVVKPMSLMDSLLFSSESEYCPLMKQTLIDLFVGIIIKSYEVTLEVARHCVTLSADENRSNQEQRKAGRQS